MHFFTFFLYLLSIGWCIELHADEAKLCQEQLIEQIIQPKTRQNAIVELRTKYQLKSQKLKAKFQRELHSEAINYDIVIIGGGPATISFIAGVRAANPLLKILVIDESDTLAPAFEGPGKALIFNSMTIYDEIEPINAHHFPNHFLQLLDFYDFIDNSKKYPTGEDISALTWSQFAHLNTDLLLQTRAVGLNVIDNESPIKVLTNDNLYVRAKAVVLATGQGHTNIQFLNAREQAKVQEAIAENDKDPSRLGIETYLQSLNYMGLNDSDPIKYEDQNVAIIGGGDADFGLIENLLGLQVPTQVYGINPHKRRPAKIVNYGAKFAPPELQEFMQNTKERYHHMRGLAGLFLPLHSPLSKSIEDLRPLLGKTLFFNKANVVSLQMVNNGKVQVVDAEGQTEVYDHVILATGYTNEAAYFLNAKFKSLANYSYHQLPEELIPVTGDISITGGSYLPGSAKLVAKDLHYSQARLGLQFKDFPIFLIANAAGAQLIVSDEEALDGSLSAHSRSKDMPRSATFSKYTLQHMLPRAYMAGNQLVLSLFSANTTSSN